MCKILHVLTYLNHAQFIQDAESDANHFLKSQELESLFTRRIKALNKENNVGN